jgi:hypothetical protein
MATIAEVEKLALDLPETERAVLRPKSGTRMNPVGLQCEADAGKRVRW